MSHDSQCPAAGEGSERGEFWKPGNCTCGAGVQMEGIPDLPPSVELYETHALLKRKREEIDDLLKVNAELHNQLTDMPTVRAYLREVDTFHKGPLHQLMEHMSKFMPMVDKISDPWLQKLVDDIRAGLTKVGEELEKLHPDTNKIVERALKLAGAKAATDQSVKDDDSRVGNPAQNETGKPLNVTT